MVTTGLQQSSSNIFASFLLVGRSGIKWHANHINLDIRNVPKLQGRAWQQRGTSSSLFLCNEDCFGSCLGKFQPDEPFLFGVTFPTRFCASKVLSMFLERRTPLLTSFCRHSHCIAKNEEKDVKRRNRIRSSENHRWMDEQNTRSCRQK